MKCICIWVDLWQKSRGGNQQMRWEYMRAFEIYHSNNIIVVDIFIRHIESAITGDEEVLKVSIFPLLHKLYNYNTSWPDTVQLMQFC